MTKIINLRQARKQRERAARRKTADGNAVKFGETKSLRTIRKAEAERSERNLAAHRRDDD
ncbi:DUF4169 family protein [Paracoccus seriniphilus]|uniref:DUF4169 domain-containing protein n=1 Tax=Paracoccus seriniphilus TaxID=184748 RepID=A0A239PN63_9RHOB|nr:DUF4169 family protein [Paracoccus seriniphilus]WCR15007.1 DUF4169 family protein [Paracoccus seriniphilus]SNT71558.1 protein of unknown function [Paracoccus seriniphilus]